VLQLGSFGGTYFRKIYSSVSGKEHSNEQKEFPSEWFKGLDTKTQLTSSTYRIGLNKYGVKCGGSLDMWQSSGWISPSDPLGWFQWYCRFFLGRRTSDDIRQISRANKSAGPTGRFRCQLINKCVTAGTSFDDVKVRSYSTVCIHHHKHQVSPFVLQPQISPVIRQSLQHWAYQLNPKDFDAHCKKKGYNANSKGGKSKKSAE
jgi:hypothetical protein